LLRIIREGHGSAGSNLDYLRNTVRHLDQLGIADGPLHRILAQAEKAETRGRAKG
jgi:cation transport protein ChaC